MSDRHEFDDIKLIGAAGLEPRDADIKELDDDLLANPDVQRALRADMAGDLGADLLGDDFDDPMPRRRRKSSAGTAIGLILLLGIAGGGGYVYLNKDQLLPLIMGEQAKPRPRVAPAPGDLPPVTPTPAPDIATSTPVVPAPDATVSVPGAMDFSDLPQPEPMSNEGVPGELPPAPPVDGAVPVVPVPVDPSVTPSASTTPVDPTAPVAVPEPAVVPNPTSAAVVPVPVPTTPTPTPTSTPAPTATTTPHVVAPDAAPKPTNDELKPVVDPVPAPVPTPAPAVSKPADGGLSKPTEPVAGGVGDDLSKIEEAMTPKDDKDEYIESTTAMQDLAETTAPRLNLTDDQKSMGLGVTVNKDTKKVDAPKPPASGAISGATATVASVDVEGKIASANRALDLERFDAAYDMFSELYKQNPRDERILMGRAVSLQKLGREGEAVAAYDELIAVNPNNPDVMINALTLVRKNNPGEALSRLLTLRQKYPTNATIAAQVGLVNAELGNFDEGLRYLNIAADLESTNPKHYFNMAVIAERMKKPGMAVEYYERALKADALSGNPKNKLNRDMVYDRLSYLRQAGNTGQ